MVAQIGVMYDGSSPGMASTSVDIKSNGMTQKLSFHPAFAGGAARTEPGFGNQNIGFTPAANVFNYFDVTLRTSGMHSFRIASGDNPQQAWSKDFFTAGLFLGNLSQVLVATDPGEIMSMGMLYTWSSTGTHTAKLLMAPACETEIGR
jgi:hypothetical protein